MRPQQLPSHRGMPQVPAPHTAERHTEQEGHQVMGEHLQAAGTHQLEGLP